MSCHLLCARVQPKTPEGSRVSRIKLILQAAFSKILISGGSVFSMNLASDLAVKRNAWDEFFNTFKEALP